MSDVSFVYRAESAPLLLEELTSPVVGVVGVRQPVARTTVRVFDACGGVRHLPSRNSMSPIAVAVESSRAVNTGLYSPICRLSRSV